MIEIIQKLDEFTEEILPDASGFAKKLFGYCELARRSSQGNNSIGEQPLPITINGTSDRKYVTLDDRYNLLTWIRLTQPIGIQNTIDGNDWAFGFDSGRVQRVFLRWVWAWKVGEGERVLFDVARQLPNTILIDGYQYVSVDKANTTIDMDHEAIYNTELGNTVYSKHRTAWNLGVLNISLEYILDPDCEGSNCCDNAFSTEDGDCLVPE